MKITNNQVFMAQNYLSGLELTNFSRDVRVAIFKDVGELSSAVKAAQEKIAESKKTLFIDLQEDAQEVYALRDEYSKEETHAERREEILNEITQYKAYLKAEDEFREIINKFGNDEVEINLTKIDVNSFIDGMIDSGNKFTAADLQKISFLFNQ